jgi:hypothetical protein
MAGHRTTVAHQLDTVSFPDESGEHQSAPCKVEDMTPDGITISRRTLAWVVGGLLTLFTGGQAAVSIADNGNNDVQITDPAVTALTGRVDSLTTKVDQLSTDGQKRDAHFNRVLNAVLIYFLESDRAQKESRPPGAKPRSEELERAAARLRALAQDE